MRCYFNLSDGNEFLVDEEGVEVVSLDLAQTETLQAILELSRETVAAGFDWGDWTLNMTDAAGQVLQTIAIRQVIAGQDRALH